MRISDWSSDVCSSDLKAGITPIQPMLQQVDSIGNFDDLYRYLVETAPIGGNPFFGAHVSAHMKNSSMNTVYLGAANLGQWRASHNTVDESTTKVTEIYHN